MSLTTAVKPVTSTRLLLSLLLIAAATGCSSRPAEPKPAAAIVTTSADDLFSVAAQPDRSTILASGKQSLFLLVTFDVPENSDKKAYRPDLNIGMVIDRSGSMSDKNKLSYAQDAASLMVDSLTATDNLAIVEYDDEISVLYPSSPVNDKPGIKTLINSLEPRGSTNLCGGMMQGVTQIKSSAAKGGMNRVLLLTDGLANTGITNPRRIAALVRNARREGITISAMGLGIDYDENLLQLIAENGGGNYYYIESPTQMARIFRQELNTLTAAVADNVVLHFYGTDAIDTVIIYGYQSTVTGRNARVPLSSLHGGEKRSVLMKLQISATAEDSLLVGKISVIYSKKGAATPSSRAFPVAVACSNDTNAVERSKNTKVGAEALLIEADETHEQLVALYEQGRKNEAKARIARMSSALGNANRTLHDKKISKKIEALNMESMDMDQADLDVSVKKAYLKSNKQRLLYAKKGIRSKYMLQNGDKGGDVEALQKKLQEQKLYSGPTDGRYSPEVESSVKTYQQKNNLECDGIAGPSTLRSLHIY